MTQGVVIPLNSEQDTIDLAAWLAPRLQAGDLLTLYGDLGSGKTFFANQIGRFLGVQDKLDSPSFVLMKEYYGGSMPVYHLDLYRIRHATELYDLGIFDLMETGITLIEWPERAEELLPEASYRLCFHFDGINRSVELSPGAAYLKDYQPK